MDSIQNKSLSLLINLIARIYTEKSQYGDTVSFNNEYMFQSSCIPNITIINYLHKLVDRFECSKECIIISFVYIDKLLTYNKTFGITSLNIHRIILISIIISLKLHDDFHYTNAIYASMGGISNSECNKLEILFLKLINWDLFVPHTIYYKYLNFLQYKSALKNNNSSILKH